MTLRFNITQEEYSEFTKHFYKKAFNVNLKWYAILAAVLIVVNLILSSNREAYEGGEDSSTFISSLLNWLLLIAIFAGIWWLILKKVRRKAFNETDTTVFLAEREMIIEEHKVKLTTKTSETTYQWAAFVKFEQTSNIFLLFIASNMAVIIPKRAFESPQQQADFEALIRRKMPDSTKMTELTNPNVLDA